MAEILLSLTIIGVVAAITLPSLTGNINERTWNTQRKALYARFSQAIALMPSLNSYGKYALEQKDAEGNITQSAVDTAAETFVTEGLAKVLKINNICDKDHLKDCGIPDKVFNTNGSALNNFTENYNTLLKFNDMFSFTYSQVDGAGSVTYRDSYSFNEYNAAAFETANGESVLVYYNPSCKSALGETSWYRIQPKMCANFVYDLNGSKGPNTVGKDIGFMTALYPTDSVVVAPIPVGKSSATTYSGISSYCKKADSEARLPNREEMSALFYNKLLVGSATGNFWTSTHSSATSVWILRFHGGSFYPDKIATGGFSVRCVKR